MQEQEMRKLIVSNLPEDIDEEELTRMFGEYGLESVHLETGKYAVLWFPDDWCAAKALGEWDDAVLRGHWLRIKKARY